MPPCLPPTPTTHTHSKHGLRLPLELFRTPYKGWGVRCASKVPVGAFVASYEGELITNEEAVSTLAESA